MARLGVVGPGFRVIMRTKIAGGMATGIGSPLVLTEGPYGSQVTLIIVADGFQVTGSNR